MSFRYVKDEHLVKSTLDFAKRQSNRECKLNERNSVFTDVPKDTRIKFIPSYLLEDDQDPNGENIVYHVDKSMVQTLKI